LGNRRM